MAFKRNNPKKNREQRKRLREERQRLRRRNKKHKAKKWFYLDLTIDDVKMLAYIREYAKEHHISKETAMRELIKKFVETQKKEG